VAREGCHSSPAASLPQPHRPIVAAAYDQLAEAEPERIRAIDASQPPEGVLDDALDAVGDLLALPSR